MKRTAKMHHRLKTILGRVVPDIERKARRIKGEIADGSLQQLVALADRFLEKIRNNKHKLHAYTLPR